jgi:ABC-type transporter Mla MlaB component
MLRITVHHKPLALTFQLEGRLAGPWLQELEQCWQSSLARQRKPTLRVDLTGVTFIDAAGQACLAAMYRQGAEFVAADCLTKAVVAEITQAPLPDGGPPKGEAKASRNADRYGEPEQATGAYSRRDSHAGSES